ncbi:ABC-three component system protein [Methylorubrum extorquens]|uniref:ABC-three component system protein n=1 Tax=Methylorubrum extorquens TaxID=408 RepID=UPI0012DB00DB|nr:ABC-three component system protein [Methylorubrum extorquens]
MLHATVYERSEEREGAPVGATAKLVPKVPTKSAAPGQYLGYGLQDVRLCHHLLKAPKGSLVSLEYIDDTAIHHPGGAALLEQSKSALSSNPLSDSSVELWKSLSNWAKLCTNDAVDPTKTLFRLYVCPPKEGELAHLMHAATTDAEAAIVLAKIARKVTPTNKAKGCNPYITQFIDTGEKTCKKIILNFRIVIEEDPIEPIRELLRLSVLSTTLDDFCAYAIGAAKNHIAALIRAGEPPVIEAEIFRKNLQAFIRKHGALGLLVPTTEGPTDTQVASALAATPVFVQQLLKINMKQEHLVRAVSDFLRSDADRTFWAADGRIVEESLDELHYGLEAHFQNMRDEVEDLHSAMAAETRGRQVYRQCVKHQAPLEGRSVPSYFIPGTYNMLANNCRVGWHPNYNNFFQDK